MTLLQHVFLASQDLIQDMQNLSAKDFETVEVLDLKKKWCRTLNLALRAFVLE